MSANISPYLSLVTSEHFDKPKFLSTVAAIVQGLADGASHIETMIQDFDLDTATGAQLDIVGLWVGRSRYISTPLVGVYFSFDIAGVGFDQGTWKGKYDPDSGLVALPDDAYRTLLRAKILANKWDGTVPAAYAAWAVVFQGKYQIVIQDNGDMSMIIGLVGTLPDAVTLALLTGGYLSLKPAGVRIAAYALPTIANTPLFGFDANGVGIAGFDTGAFANCVYP